MKKGYIVLFNGTMAVGKTTAANYFAQNTYKGVVVEPDEIRTYVKNYRIGQDEVAAGTGKQEDYEEQQELASNIAVDAAKRYLAKGFTMYLTDTAYLDQVVNMYFERLSDEEFYPILLTASFECLYGRINKRSKHYVPGDKEKTVQFLEYFSKVYKDPRWIKIDTTDLSEVQVIEKVKEVGFWKES